MSPRTTPCAWPSASSRHTCGAGMAYLRRPTQPHPSSPLTANGAPALALNCRECARRSPVALPCPLQHPKRPQAGGEAAAPRRDARGVAGGVQAGGRFWCTVQGWGGGVRRRGARRAAVVRQRMSLACLLLLRLSCCGSAGHVQGVAYAVSTNPAVSPTRPSPVTA